MSTLVKIGIAVAVVSVALATIPALKGPYNRMKIKATEALEAEYVVDNYKAEYIRLHEESVKVKEELARFTTEIKVAEKKHEYAEKQVETAKAKLVAAGTKDLVLFNRLRDAYESAKIEMANTETMIATYQSAIDKLNDTLYTIETTKSKAKANVATLESKKALIDSIKKVNSTVESLKGVNSEGLQINIEKLDDDLIRESIKLEALQDTGRKTDSVEDATAYLNSITSSAE